MGRPVAAAVGELHTHLVSCASRLSSFRHARCPHHPTSRDRTSCARRTRAPAPRCLSGRGHGATEEDDEEEAMRQGRVAEWGGTDRSVVVLMPMACIRFFRLNRKPNRNIRLTEDSVFDFPQKVSVTVFQKPNLQKTEKTEPKKIG
jgi:hypothetical protein